MKCIDCGYLAVLIVNDKRDPFTSYGLCRKCAVKRFRTDRKRLFSDTGNFYLDDILIGIEKEARRINTGE